MEKWFMFWAYNAQPHYGYGTDDEADTYQDLLNRHRSQNHFAVEEVTDPETLEGLDSGRDTDGFRLDDAIETQRENDAEDILEAALEEDRNEDSTFDAEGFSNFCPEYDAATIEAAWTKYCVKHGWI